MAWQNFDEELQKRLGYSANGGVKQRSTPRYEWRGAGSGRAKRQTGYNQTNDIGYYKDSEDWQKVSNTLGISSVNSMNDVNQMLDFVNQGRYGGGSSVKEEEKTTDNPNNNNVEDSRNEPNVSYNPTSTVVEGTNQESKEQTYDPNARRNDATNLNRWGGRADRFGMADLHSAYNSGYSYSDINNWLSTQDNNIGWADGNKGGFNSTAPSMHALNENRQGKISKGFYNPDVMGHNGGGADYFGHADLLANRKAGFSDYQILNYLDNNLDSLRGGNVKGKAGGIYEELNSMRPKDPKNLLTGGSNLGNAGYADAVKPNRSAASSSTRSSNGTSQFNRSNFGNKKKSGISSIGLNI